MQNKTIKKTTPKKTASYKVKYSKATKDRETRKLQAMVFRERADIEILASENNLLRKQNDVLSRAIASLSFATVVFAIATLISWAF